MPSFQIIKLTQTDSIIMGKFVLWFSGQYIVNIINCVNCYNIDMYCPIDKIHYILFINHIILWIIIYILKYKTLSVHLNIHV